MIFSRKLFKIGKIIQLENINVMLTSDLYAKRILKISKIGWLIVILSIHAFFCVKKVHNLKLLVCYYGMYKKVFIQSCEVEF